MPKTYEFSEVISESLTLLQDANPCDSNDEDGLGDVPNSTLAVKEPELIDATASRLEVTANPISSEYFKQWNGRVVHIEDRDSFVAMVESVKAKIETPKIVRFNRHKISIVNGDLMEEGAPFYWTVGLFRNQHKSLEKRSEIRFKMVSRPSPILLKSIGSDLETLFDGISWME